MNSKQIMAIATVLLLLPGFTASLKGERLMRDNEMNSGELERFRSYEQRFAAAEAKLPERQPWLNEEREEIAAVIRRGLNIRDEWIPSITSTVAKRSAHDGFSVEHILAESWPGVTATAHLYVPDGGTDGRRPFVLLGCGHGRGGKQAAGYQAMAYRLARMGALVLVPDNIGQGEREPMGHRDVVEVFAHELSVQGLIVMETMGWLRWARQDPRVDSERMAAIGNSGGGTLTLFLAALCRDELAVLSSSAYPSSFSFIAAKRKKHCHCNILPDLVGAIEMWQVLGSFAPKPLFVFQGREDHLFPWRYFEHTAERLQHVYRQAEAADQLRTEIFPGQHPWDTPRRRELSAFLKKTLDLPGAVEEDDPPEADPPGTVLARWPSDALDVDALAARLSGRPRIAVKSLDEVYPSAPQPVNDARALSRQIWAQYEAFLAE